MLKGQWWAPCCLFFRRKCLDINSKLTQCFCELAIFLNVSSNIKISFSSSITTVLFFFLSCYLIWISNDIKESISFFPPQNGDRFWSLRIFCWRVWKLVGCIVKGSPTENNGRITEQYHLTEGVRRHLIYKKKRNHFNFYRTCLCWKARVIELISTYILFPAKVFKAYFF